MSIKSDVAIVSSSRILDLADSKGRSRGLENVFSRKISGDSRPFSLDHLNIFTHPNGTKLFGPAGAGKTRTLVDWLSEHEADGDFRIAEGIVCSFTRAAARDISRRVRGDREPGPYHTTIHSLAKRYHSLDLALAEPRLGEFFGAERIAYDRASAPDPDIWLDSGSSPGNLINAFWGRCRNQLISFDEGMRREAPIAAIMPYWNPSAMDRLFRAYKEWKDSERLIDYTDMLELAADAPPSGMQWPVFVMDECQDSTALQWKVAQGFAAASEVCYLGGDDDQAIYSWAGAHPDQFLAADVGAEEILHVNHRSGSEIVDYAQAFIRRNRRRVDKQMTSAREGGCVEDLVQLPALALAASTFVMARAHYLMKEWMAELEERAFPFIDRRGQFGINGKAALAFRRFLTLRQGKKLALSDWRLLATDAIGSQGPWLVRGAKTRLKELDRAFAEATYVGVEEIGMYGATEELQNAIRSGATGPLTRLPQKRLGYLRRVAEKHGTEYLDEARAGAVCQVGPIHQFKGLECDHAVLHSGMSPAATREATISPEAERRVIYVAMTRAKERLSIVHERAASQWQEIL